MRDWILFEQENMNNNDKNVYVRREYWHIHIFVCRSLQKENIRHENEITVQNHSFIRLQKLSIRSESRTQGNLVR